jgi:hypothetical protein
MRNDRWAEVGYSFQIFFLMLLGFDSSLGLHTYMYIIQIVFWLLYNPKFRVLTVSFLKCTSYYLGTAFNKYFLIVRDRYGIVIWLHFEKVLYPNFASSHARTIVISYCTRIFIVILECNVYLSYIKNQQDATLAVLFISNCKITLHVSDASRVHHQEY